MTYAGKVESLSKALIGLGFKKEAEEALSLLEDVESDNTLMQRLESGSLDGIKYGDKDDPPRDYSVSAVQKLLLDKGYYMPAGADGIFGSQTRGAVSSFQRENNNLLSGVIRGEVGSSTLDGLRSNESVGPTPLMDLPCEGRILDAFADSLARKESGGNYNAVNRHSGANGKYQIMPKNWPSWSRQAGLSEDAPQTPENQEVVARYHMCKYYERYRDWWLVAVAWYSGPGGVAKMQNLRGSGDLSSARKRITYKGQGSYSGIASYADKVVKRFYENLGQPYEIDELGSPSLLSPSGISGPVDDNIDRTLIIGDSQAVGNLGAALAANVPNLVDNISGVGWTAKDVPAGKLEAALRSYYINLVIISLGGNGADGSELALAAKIRELAPDAKIVWIGAFPPTKAVGESWRKDLYTEEGVEAARENRQRTNDTIRSAVGRHAHFIDPHSYECQSGCDGIHLPAEVANSFVSDMASHFVSDPYSFLLS